MSKKPANKPGLKDRCETFSIHPDVVAKVKEKDLDGLVAIRLSEIYKIMGDPTRLKIINALTVNEMCVCDLACLLGMEQSAVSHHLRLLRGMRIVKFRKDGKCAYYELDDEHVLTLFNEGLKHITES
jgi:Predicted transcriptional regulators